MASFLLHPVSLALAILFSICQGYPLASLIFVLYLEMFQVLLEAVLRDLRFRNMSEAYFAYMDDMVILRDNLHDLHTTDLLCREFEAASGAISNRNRKTVILRLGSWAGRLIKLLDWLMVATSVKVLSFSITPPFPDHRVGWHGGHTELLEEE